MADVVRETHYHNDGEAHSGSSGLIAAAVVIVLVLLAIFLVTRGFGGDGSNSDTTPTQDSGVQVEGPASGSYNP